MVVSKADMVLAYCGHRSTVLMRMMWRNKDGAYRAGTFMSVADCEVMAAHGLPIPVSADATTKWIHPERFLHESA